MKRLTAIATLLLAHLASPAALAAEAGSVIFAAGTVTAERQPPEALSKGDAVLDDDTIVTGAASRAQLLMVDGAKIGIRPESVLRIEEYEYADPAAAVIATGGDKSVISLVKGGFRTITGAIGKEEEDDYEVRTPVGVLGIRGTDFAVLLCTGDCGSAPGVSPGTPVEDGLYLAVYDGTIVFTTIAETIELSAGQFAFIPLESREPEILDRAPPVLLEDLDFEDQAGQTAGKPGRTGDGSGDGGAQFGFDAKLGTRRSPSPATAAGTEPPEEAPGSSTDEAPAQPVIATDPDGTPVDITPGTPPDPQGPRPIGYSGGPFGTLDLPATNVAENAPGDFALDASFDLTNFDSTVPGRVGTVISSFDIGTAGNAESGFDSLTVLRWGRWSGGTIDVTLSDGSSESVDLGNQSVHWVAGPAQAPPSIPVTGTATYSLIGGTSPTDNFGNVGVLGGATFQANFTNLTVDSTLSLDINGMNWSAAGTGAIGDAVAPGFPAHLFQGFYNSVIIDGVTGGSGDFSGFFSEPGPTSDPSFPGGAGLSYRLSDPQGFITVFGVAVFGDP